jgi:esterase/lipase superfamily enzyme
MANRHWIITNREVRRKRVGNKFVERVDEDNWKEALPIFRVADFDMTGLASESERSELVGGTSFIEDRFIDGGAYTGFKSTDDPKKLAGSKRLFLSLYQRMCEAPKDKGDVLFFMHGFNYSWSDALVELARLHEVYVEPDESPIDQILLFSWPSYGSRSRYKSDQAIAYPSGQMLGRVFGKAVAYHEARFGGKDSTDPYCGQRIHIAAHSMGNQVMQEFLRSVNEQGYLRRSIFGEALLLNADADWSALESPRPLSELHEYAKRTHIYTHCSDDALFISEATKNDEKRLGKHGPRDPRLIPPRTILVDASDLKGTIGTIRDDDPMLKVATRVLGTSVSTTERLFDHWGYLNRPEVVADIYRVLKQTSSSEMAQFRKYKGEKRYKLLPG